MKKFILGFFLGIAVLFAFLYFGGARYVKVFGVKTEEAGEKLEKYEKQIKESAGTTGEKVKETAKSAGETVKETARGVRKSAGKAVDRTKEKVKEYSR